MPSVRVTQQQRDALKRMQPGVAWAKKVNLMSPQEVDSIFQRLKQQGKI